jgi:hypothetical protein
LDDPAVLAKLGWLDFFAGQGRDLYRTIVRGLAVAAIVVAASVAVSGEDDFPIVGVYTKDRVCKGDGSDPSDVLVTITYKDIQSSLGYCTILSNRRDGRTFFVHVSCKMAGDQTILGDVTFKQRDDNALDFDDQDHTSTGVLYKCAK